MSGDMLDTIYSEYLKKPYHKVFIINPDGSYSAEILEFEGCFSDGETIGDAMLNLDSAAFSWMESALHIGQSIPEPFDGTWLHKLIWRAAKNDTPNH